MPGSDESTEAKLQLCYDFHHFSAFQPSLILDFLMPLVGAILYRQLSQNWEVATLLRHYSNKTKLVLGLLELSC